ncbi:MAG: hypothetical protein E7639_06390 [Ruminococcaceae bacterium]|nr:hypothetical protein [Oscillospiraceae bacterium]
MENPYTAHCHLPPQQIRRYNAKLAELFSLYLNLMPSAIDKAMIDELASTCHISRAEAFAQYLAAMAGLQTEGRDRSFFRYWLLPSIYELNAADYTNDAYFQSIRIPNATIGRWELRPESLRPFEAFVCNDFVVTPEGRMLPQIGFFDEEYPFPAVLENGCEWMTLQPNEMVTTMPAIKAAHGRVLTFGLGLGYFAYHAAQKPDVESVTVVDISEDVIDLFKTHILPQFPHREKIKLIKEDAFSFADTRLEGNFDFVFADIWHDAGDGRELYLKMKEYEKKHPDIHFTFWLENTIKCYLNKDLWP